MNVVAKIPTNMWANSKIYNKSALKAFSLKTEIGHNV